MFHFTWRKFCGRLMAWRQSADGPLQVACTEAIARLIQRHLHGEFAHLGGAVRDQIVGVLSGLDLSLRQRISQNLASSDIMVQLRAVQLLGMMGNAAAVKSALTRALKSSDPKVRATVISVFRTVANRQDLNLLLDLTKDEDVRVRANVVEVLGELEEKGVISVLLQFKHDPNNRIRANCLRSLWRLGHAPAEIESSVAKMIDDPDDKMRASAAWLIGEIGHGDPRFSPMLKKLMADPAELVQTNVMKALLKIGGVGAQKLLGLLFADAEPGGPAGQETFACEETGCRFGDGHSGVQTAPAGVKARVLGETRFPGHRKDELRLLSNYRGTFQISDRQ